MKKRIAEHSPEEQERIRKYNREQKQKSREAQKAARYVPTADEVSDAFAIKFPEQVKALNAYVKEFSNKVVTELGRDLGSPQKDLLGNVVGYDHDEQFTVDRVARCLLSLKQGWGQKVQEGELVAGQYFSDSSGTMVESANRHILKNSPTFNTAYFELLKMLDKRYGREQTNDAAVVRAELAGTYVLPPTPELPKAEPNKIHETPVLWYAETLERGRIQLLNQLSVQDPNLSPDARRYLDGTV